MPPKTLFALLAAIPALAAAADQAGLSGPVLGYVFDPGLHQLRPILGLPGASRQGPPLATGVELRSAAISPSQQAAIAASDTVPVLMAFELAPGTSPLRHDIEGSSPGLSEIAFTPNGRAAALWSANARHIQIVVGLPSAPQLASDLDVSSLPGPVSAVALSDGGTLIVAVTEGDRAGVYRLEGAAAASVLWTGSAVAALSFIPGQDDALIADKGTREVFLVRSVTGSPAPMRLAGEPEGIVDPVAVQSGAGAVHVANASGAVVSIDLAGGGVRNVACRCRPSALQRLSGDGVFSLTGPDAETMWLLDAGPGGTRVVFVPPDASLPRREAGPGRSGSQR